MWSKTYYYTLISEQFIIYNCYYYRQILDTAQSMCRTLVIHHFFGLLSFCNVHWYNIFRPNISDHIIFFEQWTFIQFQCSLQALPLHLASQHMVTYEELLQFSQGSAQCEN